MLKIFLVACLAAYASAENKAIAVLQSSTGVTGSITFTETKDGILVDGIIKGLTPGKHGFHIHSKGDLTDGCMSTGSHFNPHNKSHGAPDVENRHVGDLGNVEANNTGVAKFTMTDKVICLTGENGILGRAVVVHSGVDDLGLKNTEESRTTGSAGSRVGCGVIGILSDDFQYNAGVAIEPSTLLLTLFLAVLFIYYKY